MADYKNEEGETVGTNHFSFFAGEGEKPLFEETYTSETIPASVDIVTEASRVSGIEIPGNEIERLSRVLDIVREDPTTTAWSVGIGIGSFFLGFKKQKEFAKVTVTEKTEKKKK